MCPCCSAGGKQKTSGNNNHLLQRGSLMLQRGSLKKQPSPLFFSKKQKPMLLFFSCDFAIHSSSRKVNIHHQTVDRGSSSTVTFCAIFVCTVALSVVSVSTTTLCKMLSCTLSCTVLSRVSSRISSRIVVSHLTIS